VTAIYDKLRVRPQEGRGNYVVKWNYYGSGKGGFGAGTYFCESRKRNGLWIKPMGEDQTKNEMGLTGQGAGFIKRR